MPHQARKPITTWRSGRMVLALVLPLYLMPAIWPHLIPQSASPSPKPKEEVITGFVRGSGPFNLQPGALSSITMSIKEYSSDDEISVIQELLHSEGIAPTLKKLRTMDKGRFSAGRVASNLALVRTLPTDTGRLINAVLSFPADLRADIGIPANECSFEIVELHLDNNGKGTGGMIFAKKLDFDKNGMVLAESCGAPVLGIANASLHK